MSETIEIDVTQDDINRGVRNNPWHCPISSAVKRRFKRRFKLNSEVTTDRNSCHICSEGGCCWFRLDDTASQFILDFDMGQPVSPFKFTVPMEKPCDTLA